MKFKFVLWGVPLIVLLCAPILGAAQNPFHAKAWPKTDFGTFLVDPGMIVAGGPAKDGIPAIDAPRMLPAGLETRIDPQEPVVTLSLPQAPARAYPLRYLLWHEVVNDSVGGQPVAVTYAALYDSVMVFDRRLPDGSVLDFGVSGLLHRSDTLLYDRETESWWQQANGRAITGTHAGKTLTALRARVESWESFRASHRHGLVMARPTEWKRDYGTTPFPGYDSARVPALYQGPLPPHDLPPLSRVVRVGDVAWPLARLMAEGRIVEAGYIVTWAPGMRSSLDTPDLTRARDIGMVRVRDRAGRDVPHDMLFAFGFAALWPAGKWMLGDCSGKKPGQPC